MAFIRGANPIWFMSNLVGQPLDDTYYAFFLSNDLPYAPQSVFQDISGLIPLTNPLEFTASSGLPTNLYFNDTEVYRIEIRQGPDQTYPLVYLIENYDLGGSSGSSGTNTLLTATNMITNPQFVDAYFNSPLFISSAPANPVALGPGWSLILSGVGTMTVTHNYTAGSSSIQGNPASYLTFTNTGLTATLRQTFTNNGAIFDGGAVAIAVSAFCTTNAEPLVVTYSPSTAASATTILSKTIPTGNFSFYAQTTQLPTSTNSDTNGTAYVNIDFVLPTNGTISLSNIQIVGQSFPIVQPYDLNASSPAYQEQTYERMVDQEFHVYKNSILIQPKESILTGWNFPLNPWQFTNPARVTATVKCAYYADQTIIYQQAGTSKIGVGQSGSPQNNALEIYAVAASGTQFAVIQYIDPSIISPYWRFKLSSLVRAQLATTNATTIKIKMRLIWRTSLPNTIGATEPIASWTPGGDPVFAAGWTALAPDNDPAYTLVNGVLTNYAFNNFQLPSASTATMTLGVVVYTINDMSNVASPNVDNIVFDQINLVPNSFALESNVQTYNQVLRQCQFYYETSFPAGTYFQTASFPSYTGLKLFQGYLFDAGAYNALYPTSFSFDYKQVKRSAPTLRTGAATANQLVIISPISGTINYLGAGINENLVWSTPQSGTNPIDVTIAGWTDTAPYGVPTNSSAALFCSSCRNMIFRTNGAGVVQDEPILFYHYAIDCTLGGPVV